MLSDLQCNRGNFFAFVGAVSNQFCLLLKLRFVANNTNKGGQST
jgi:hypothetical protein